MRMPASVSLARGRAAFDRNDWGEAFRGLAAADRSETLEPDDLDRLATTAYLVGDDTTSANARARAHAAFLERGDLVRAARSAFWLAFALISMPAQQSQGNGWFARAKRLLDDA